MATQAVATKIMITIYASDRKKEKLSLGAFFITVLASILASVFIGERWGIQVSYKEATALAVVSTITNIVAMLVLDF
ncbi:MAG: hypothetical protein KBA81_02745 [Rhabdochlamydiaceae bacterium]|nr:hypothetical protein [Rhabdochlamydiaceae bacterium]